MIDHTDFSVVVKQRGRPPCLWRWEIYRAGRNTPVEKSKDFLVVSRIFRTLVWAERRPALAQAVIAPLICWSFSSSMFKYLLIDHAVPAMCRSLAAARFSAD